MIRNKNGIDSATSEHDVIQMDTETDIFTQTHTSIGSEKVDDEDAYSTSNLTGTRRQSKEN